MKGLQDKVAVVTGGSSGIGQAIAIRLADEGAHVAINYVGHAERWDSLEIDGDLSKRDCSFRYKQGGRTAAVVTISRDLESLQAECEMER